MADNPEFVRLLKQYQEYKGLSDTKLGKLVGVNRRTVWGWKNARSHPRYETVLKIVNALDLDPHEQQTFIKAAGYSDMTLQPRRDESGKPEKSSEKIDNSKEHKSAEQDLGESDSQPPQASSSSVYTNEVRAVFRAFDNSLHYLTDKVEVVERSNKQLLAWQVMPKEPVALELATAKLAELPLDHVPEVAPLPDGSRMLLRNNPLFVGREEELLHLASLLKGGETVAVGQIAAATGIGGVGKTQLAATFVHHYGQYFQGGVFWLNFADPAMIPTEISQCGTLMKEVRPDYIHLDLADQVELVKGLWQRAIPRLLVFDNCEESTLLDKWQPTSGGCRILVTSRRRQWDAALNVKTLEISTLRRLQSLELLHKFPEQWEDIPPFTVEEKPTLNDIAHELGDLPLALHMAGNYLATYRDDMSPESYLEQLQAIDPLEHISLQEGDISPTKHEQHVARTFALSYQQLDMNAPIDALALRLLVHLACFAPGELIPKELLRLSIAKENSNDTSNTQSQFSSVLNRLSQLGLIQIEAKGQLSFHRLLFFFTQRRIENESYVKAGVAVNNTLLDEAHRIKQTGIHLPLLEWEVHLRHRTDLAKTQMDEMAAALCNILSIHLAEIGEIFAAKPYCILALDISKVVFGDKHPTTATKHLNLGILLLDMADLNAALRHTEFAFMIQREVLGIRHVDTALSIRVMSTLLYKAGNFAEAKLHCELALDIHREILGDKHPTTAVSHGSLGAILRESGDLNAAKFHIKMALDVHKDTLGEEHPITVNSLSHLAYLLEKMGDLSNAKSYYEKALESRIKLLGDYHPQTAVSYSNLGTLLRQMGEYDLAKTYLERNMDINRKLLGEKHVETANSFSNMGILLQRMGDFDASHRYHTMAFDRYIGLYGENHFETANSYSNLGSFMQEIGEWGLARTYLEQALAIRKEVLGVDHPDTATSLSNLGSLFKNIGNLGAAKSYFEQSLVIRKEVLDDNHPHISTNLSDLGETLHDMGKLDEAKSYYEESLLIAKEVLGEHHLSTANRLNNLGSLLQDIGDLEAAKPYLTQSMEIHKAVLGEWHHETATSFNNLGLLLLHMGDYDAAKTYLEQALAIHKKSLGEKHPSITVGINNLGLLWHEKGDLHVAKQYYEEALELSREVLGNDHHGTADTLYNIGALSYTMNDLPAAKHYYEEAWIIYKDQLGLSHPRTQKVERALSNLRTRPLLSKLDRLSIFITFPFTLSSRLWQKIRA